MVVGPAWTRREIEKPAGRKNMGTWIAAVYTDEQQRRLGVNESGQKAQLAPAPVALVSSSRTAIMRGAEQGHQGLHEGYKGACESGKESTECAVIVPVAITPYYARALLNSPLLLAHLTKTYFKNYDTNKNGILELGEIKVLCQDLHKTLGLSFSHVDLEAVKTSIAPFAKGQVLKAEDFPAWFKMVMQDSISATPVVQQECDMEVKIKELSEDTCVLYGFSKVDPFMTAGTLREIVASQLDFPVSQVRLIIGGAVLSDTATMEELQISPDSKVIVEICS
eukprot:TRINITY_DN67739_c0_g1_i1.p1 TRINITY_DN67739_c0_g1~~TRINITY_DN67739_c0_g1_i1.p1  ORF type:complete len:280 (+),score=57.64 TRINITY_DN67739_c0_g1_i1:60-899(+)